MMNNSPKEIFYLARYGSDAVAERLPFRSRAGEIKADYIISVLKKTGLRVCLISYVSSLKPGYCRRKAYEADSMERHIYLESLNVRNKLLRKIAAVFRLAVLFAYLVANLDHNDTLLVYHYHLYSVPVRLAKAFKRFRLILEIEEIFYKEARSALDVRLERTERALLRSADAYLAINELVRAEYCGSKPAVISYGAYSVPPQYATRYDDGRIHLVYAGLINATHGAHTAIETMRCLDDSYRLHIYGFGSAVDIEVLNRLIAEANNLFGSERIFYYGTKTGSDFDSCLQRCHIGLNFNITLHPGSGKYSFPSKIPSYLGHGLNVLTYRIPSVEHSAFNPFVQYYDEEAPESIARAVGTARLDPYASQTDRLRSFDRVFSEDLSRLLETEKKK